jgi:hypothetical protein
MMYQELKLVNTDKTGCGTSWNNGTSAVCCGLVVGRNWEPRTPLYQGTLELHCHKEPLLGEDFAEMYLG